MQKKNVPTFQELFEDKINSGGKFKTVPMTPFNKEEMEQGIFKLPPLFDVFPTKMSMSENSAAYLIQDDKDNCYAMSIGAVVRLGWNDYDFPPVDQEFKEKWEKRKS